MTDLVSCVVFDVDDTLYLERDYARSGFAAVGAHLERVHGIAGLGEAAWSLFERGARGTIFNDALRAVGAEYDDALIRQLVDVYRDHKPAIELLPDAREALDALKARGVALAGITDGPVASQRRKVEVLGLDRWLDPMVVTGELGPDAGKPSPRSYELVQARTGATGSQCVYIADNPGKDFIAARALGWHTVRIRRTGGLHATVPSGTDVDLEITELDELTAQPWYPA